MNHNSFKHRLGFTMVEMVLVIAIFGVLAAMGWGSTRTQMPRYRLIRTAKMFKADLLSLRNLAVQANRETRLTLLEAPDDCDDISQYGGRWKMEIGGRSRHAESWDVLPADVEEDGTDDDQSSGFVDLGAEGNREARDVCLLPWGEIRGPGAGNNDGVVFSPRGWLTNPTNDFNANGYIEFTFSNQFAAYKGVVDQVSVLVSRAGMVRLHSTLGEETTDNPIGTEATTTRP